MKYLKVGDVFRFEYPNEPQHGVDGGAGPKILSIARIVGGDARGEIAQTSGPLPEDLVFWDDGSHTKVKHLDDLPRLVIGGRPPRKGDVFAFFTAHDLTVTAVHARTKPACSCEPIACPHDDQRIVLSDGSLWNWRWPKPALYPIPRVVISDEAHRDLFYFADRVGELPYDHLATPPPVAPTPTPTLEGLKTMLTNTTTQQPVPSTKAAENAPNQIFIEGAERGTTRQYRVVLIPPKNTGWLPGLVIEVQSDRRDAMGVPQWDSAPEGTEAKRYQPYEIVLAALAQKIVELEAAVAELKTINEIKGVKSLASHYGATLGG